MIFDSAALRLAVAAFLLSVAFIAGWTVNGWRWQAAVDGQKAQAAQALADATERTRQAEQRWNSERDLLEKNHGSALARVEDEARRARRAVVAHGLRDPGGRAGGHAAVPATASPAAGAAVAAGDGRKLSDEAAEFLLGEAERADRFAAIAQTCRDYALKMQAAAKESP